MADKLIIVMANTDPRNGEELGAPIFQATVAAAMDYDVDVICTATAGRLMKKGVADELFVKEGSPKSVYSFIQDAHEAGAKFYCCSPNLDLFDMSKEDLIPECEGIIGGAHLIDATPAASGGSAHRADGVGRLELHSHLDLLTITIVVGAAPDRVLH